MSRGQKCAVLASLSVASTFAVTLTTAPRELVMMAVLTACTVVVLIFTVAGQDER